MFCSLCRHGEAVPGRVTVTLERGTTTVVIKRVPANVCENCGEYWLSEAVTEELLSRAEEAAQRGVELELLLFAA